MVKNLPCNAGNTGSIPESGKIPHVTGQQSLYATTTEPTPGDHEPQREKPLQ